MNWNANCESGPITQHQCLSDALLSEWEQISACLLQHLIESLSRKEASVREDQLFIISHSFEIKCTSSTYGFAVRVSFYVWP